MSRLTEAFVATCAFFVACVAAGWLLFPEDRRHHIYIELRPVQPVESTGDRAATEGV